MLSRERYWVIDVRQFMRASRPDMKPTLKQQRSKESTLWPSTYAPQFISASHKIPDEIFTWALQQFRILYPTRCMIVILISKPHTNNQGRSPSAISKIQGTVRNGRRSLDMEALGARRRRWTPDLYDRWPMGKDRVMCDLGLTCGRHAVDRYKPHLCSKGDTMGWRRDMQLHLRYSRMRCHWRTMWKIHGKVLRQEMDRNGWIDLTQTWQKIEHWFASWYR